MKSKTGAGFFFQLRRVRCVWTTDVSLLAGAVTSVRGVNKVDAATLGANFGSLAVRAASHAIRSFICPTLFFSFFSGVTEVYACVIRSVICGSAIGG